MRQYVSDSIIEKYSLLDSSVMDEIAMLKYHDEQIFNSITSNKDIQEALSLPPSENTNERYEQYRQLTQMLSINTTYGSITAIYLVGENNQSLRSSMQLADIVQNNPERFAAYYDAAVASSGKPVWSATACSMILQCPASLWSRLCIPGSSGRLTEDRDMRSTDMNRLHI